MNEAVQDLARDLLIPSKTNPRTRNKEPDEKFVSSIKEHGVLEPLVVREHPEKDGVFEIVFGERRWIGAGRAGLANVPCIVRVLSDDQVVEQQLIENVQREDLHPLDEAESFVRLTRLYGGDTQRVAVRACKPHSYVLQSMKLVELCKAGKQAFEQGKISVDVARLVACLSAESMQEHALEEVVVEVDSESKEGAYALISTSEARRRIETVVMLNLKGAPFALDDAELVPKAGPCTMCPKRTGTQRSLFADASSEDLCTDRVCHRSKLDAHFVAASKLHRDRGGEVMPKKEAKETFSDFSQHARGYTPLDQKVTVAGGKHVPLGKLLEQQEKAGVPKPATVLAQHPKSGVVLELVKSEVAHAAIAREEKKTPGKATDSFSQSQARQRREQKIAAEARRRTMDAYIVRFAKAIGSGAEPVLEDKVCDVLAEGAIGGAWHEVLKASLARRARFAGDDPKPKAKKKGARVGGRGVVLAPAQEQLRKLAKDMGAHDLLCLVFELLVSQSARAWDLAGKVFGVSYAEQLAAVKADDNAKREAKPKKTTAAKAKAPSKAPGRKTSSSAKPKAKTAKPAKAPRSAKTGGSRARRGDQNPGSTATPADRGSRGRRAAKRSEAGPAAASPPSDPPAAPRCRVCGCTPEQTCPGGCKLKGDLCSKCRPVANPRKRKGADAAVES